MAGKFGCVISLRSFHKPGFLALLCAFALNVTHWGSQQFHSVTETEQADIAISAKTIESCHHHPHGCPKDCMCPKILINIEDSGRADSWSLSEAEGRTAPRLHEPALVTCTEHGQHSVSSAFAVFIPEASYRFQILETEIPVMADRRTTIPDSFQEPPQKIPIV